MGQWCFRGYIVFFLILLLICFRASGVVSGIFHSGCMGFSVLFHGYFKFFFLVIALIILVCFRRSICIFQDYFKGVAGVVSGALTNEGQYCARTTKAY